MTIGWQQVSEPQPTDPSPHSTSHLAGWDHAGERPESQSIVHRAISANATEGE